MPAYLILTREEPVQNAEAMSKYQKINRENSEYFKQQYGLTPLVVYGRLETLEGNSPDGMVILQFPTMTDAKAWYNSTNYQAALPFRKKAASHRAILIEGL